VPGRKLLILTIGSMLFLLLASSIGQPQPTPEERAIAYLAREVPAWSAKNKCHSCHNNGDAVRALYMAKRLKLAVPAKALEETSRWLARPTGWALNGGQGPYNDKILSTVQFAAALADGLETGVIEDRDSLKLAAELVVGKQAKDGHWQIGDGASIGSPATLGDCLATVFARSVLVAADAKKHKEVISAADRWLRTLKAKNVLDSAALLWGLADASDADAAALRKQCLILIRKGEAKDGGWGPYVNSAAETFDTAVVVLALIRQKDSGEFAEMLRRGRAVLLSTQQKDGSWMETTRPAGGDSYAQRVSTTGWATQALLATQRDKELK
jgi:hypothetical protein